MGAFWSGAGDTMVAERVPGPALLEQTGALTVSAQSGRGQDGDSTEHPGLRRGERRGLSPVFSYAQLPLNLPFSFLL